MGIKWVILIYMYNSPSPNFPQTHPLAVTWQPHMLLMAQPIDFLTERIHRLTDKWFNTLCGSERIFTFLLKHSSNVYMCFTWTKATSQWVCFILVTTYIIITLSTMLSSQLGTSLQRTITVSKIWLIQQLHLLQHC